MTEHYTLKIRRVYDDINPDDGFRILVDRLWPRGLTKDKAKIDLWLKDIAPSDELRKWFGHDPSKWQEFKKRYQKELEGKKELVDSYKQTVQRKKVVTLVFSASDEKHNNAVALKELITL